MGRTGVVLEMAKTSGFLQITRRQSYAVVSLKRDPVNSLNLEFWKQLLQTLESLEADPAVRGVIFQSGLARDVFTAGNDILELYAPKTSKQRYRRVADMDLLGSVPRGCPAGRVDGGHALARRRRPPPAVPARRREFWVTQNLFLSRLYVSPLVTVAAIRGACPAGGCCLAMCCDYRVMTESGYIGLNGERAGSTFARRGHRRAAGWLQHCACLPSASRHGTDRKKTN